ncbi:MAG: hypothetical protein HOE62_01005 [Alphaproteobacteria bacterium]|nr:hypothetical protein [Alphaproteobacteria bacterium]MBT4016497.1 hypothetical protein [Alphaproteobacteria bacterium]MBT5160084.1 hypothetical protein [Alphaproteobacteria bacterium]MBT6387413.1 hypothetical protein [Alphaproteobacteria bacterium]
MSGGNNDLGLLIVKVMVRRGFSGCTGVFGDINGLGAAACGTCCTCKGCDPEAGARPSTGTGFGSAGSVAGAAELLVLLVLPGTNLTGLPARATFRLESTENNATEATTA